MRSGVVEADAGAPRIALARTREAERVEAIQQRAAGGRRGNRDCIGGPRGFLLPSAADKIVWKAKDQ